MAMKIKMEIKTERLILTKLTLDDVDNVYSLTSDEEIAKYMRFDTHNDIKQAYDLVFEYVNSKSAHPFAIRQKEDNKFVGIFVLKKYDDNSYEMSTFMGKEFWGKKYNQETLKAIKQYAKEELNADALYGYVVVDNIASCKSLLNNGFVLHKTIPIDIPCGLNIYKLDLTEV